MWNDQRTGEQCAMVTAQVGLDNLLKLIGNRTLPGFTAPKIKWVAENEPQVYEKVAKVLLPKDYIRYRLSGEFYSEVLDASGTSLFDVGKRQWSSEMLKAFGVPFEWLPEVTESPVASTIVGKKVAKQTDLIEGTQILGGAGDQAAQAVGIGLVRQGEVSAKMGTSEMVFAASDAYRVQPACIT